MGVISERRRLKPRSAPATPASARGGPATVVGQLPLHLPGHVQAAGTANMITPAATESAGAAAGRGVLIGLLSAFGSAALVGLLFACIYFFRYTTRGRILLDRIGRPGEYDDEQARAKEEAEALENMDEISRQEYLRAKAFIEANPPDSVPTDISLSQFLAIQEKGVSAWEFEAELEIANCFVEARTEIEFFDSICSVQSNLPIPKQNDVYYWETKLYDKPENTLISIGLSTKPYPMFRLPGYHKHSVAYTSSGLRRHNQPFSGTPYGPAFIQGDVIGCGYRPRTGTIFFTRNGKKLDDVAHGLKSHNFFPTIGANGPSTIHVNFGQSGFVFIEANVKKWGLAPMTGSLAPPPPYGSEEGTVLVQRGQDASDETAGYFPPGSPATVRGGRGRANSALRTNTSHAVPPTSPGPARSPTDISLASIDMSDERDTRSPSPPPDYCSQSSADDNDEVPAAHTRKQERAEERRRLLAPAPRSPTPAYRDVVGDRSPNASGGRGRSGSAPAGPSSSGRL